MISCPIGLAFEIVFAAILISVARARERTPRKTVNSWITSVTGRCGYWRLT